MLTRYRMDVVCATIADAIAYAGGLICDRSLTGWDIRVFATRDDPTAQQDLGLRILGATRAGSMPLGPAEEPLLRTVVVSGDLYRSDDGVRRWVEAAMRETGIEVLVWDIPGPGSDSGQVKIPVSRAAAIFVDHAKAVVDCDATSGAAEFYRRLRTGRMRQPARRQTTLTTVNGG
ncbi:hypothetical protein [Mycobacterium sp. SA01]|uniref:hypothetical protein n=1 Tax=Mycobacterium sp. SA01 TaxID=3238820 RepID=UPI00351B5A40